MTDDPSNAKLPLELVRKIDALCGQFEAGLRSGQPVDPGSLLDQMCPVARSVLLPEMFLLELEFRPGPERLKIVAEWRQRFPEYHHVIEAAAAVAADRLKPSAHLAIRQERPAMTVDPSPGSPVLTTDRPPPPSDVPVGPTVDGIGDSLAEDVSFTVSGSDENVPAHLGRHRVKKLLGQGGFGRVFLAYDEQLKRPVAIKVPRRDRVTTAAHAEAYLTEARVLASLDHPHVVPVHDVGQTEDGLPFVVSKFIEGSDLATKLRDTRFTFSETARLVATVADALQYAHQNKIIHRDLKPANILLDKAGKPYLADFGLALKEEDFGKGRGVAGTPAYMSPEQASGEGHLVDGRTDIFSLGVVLYEMLTGRCPFVATNSLDVMIQVRTVEARPPRQLDATIPKELERITLKALAKRASERYTTAFDLADDLRHWSSETEAVATAERSSAAQAAVKIVPKGLRSFDPADADFFLELLPGPRDREGLPEGIRFWKNRIEAADADKTFRVGLLYGPSGCGKSSLVKAGLLPRLGDQVIAVYVEATAEDTEARLSKALGKHGLPSSSGLVEALAQVRRGQGLPAGKKLLIILDQFEQWLHVNREAQDTELVQALRQCDGGRLQCIVMVRDDFWMAATRFMSDLEVNLVQGQNCAAVDLFDFRHAKKVLALFGRAFGALQEDGLTKEQEIFLDQAAAGLAEEGKIISVHLALFAEMVKSKPWTPATLKELGGTAGVGLVFLDETFSASTAPPQHRLHQNAAQALLKELLPETGSAIKGKMRSREALLEASGYGNRPRDFDALIEILDSDTRLITPTEQEGVRGQGPGVRQNDDLAAPRPASLTPDPSPLTPRYYQLTHDYLVPSLREWLTRRQKETARGRAELLLADRAGVWNARPENRQLPSSWQWSQIRARTRKKNWTPPERRMMQKAARYHGLRVLVLFLLLAAATAAGLVVRGEVIERNNAAHAAGLVSRLLDANISQVPEIISDLEPYRTWADPLLQSKNATATKDTPRKLRTSMALLPVDSAQVDYLYERLLAADANEAPVIRDALAPYKDALLNKLWAVVEEPEKGKEPQRLRAAAALAQFDRANQRWKKSSTQAAEDLVSVSPVYLGLWSEMFRPVKNALVQPLSKVFREHQPERTAERSAATSILADYAADQPRVLADLLVDADEKQFVVLFPKLRDHGELGRTFLHAELGKQLRPVWPDSPLPASWKEPDAERKSEIEAADGILAERFAFCQTMLLEEFDQVAEALRKSGFRPIQFRPHPAGKSVQVAAVWTRDGQDWRLARGLTAAEMRRRDAENQKDQYRPVDATAYPSEGHELFAGLWSKSAARPDKAFLEVGLDEGQLKSRAEALARQGYRYVVLSSWAGADGKARFNGVWDKAVDQSAAIFTGIEVDYSGENHRGDLQVDVQITKGGPVSTGRIERRYAAVWHPSVLLESTEIHGLPPGEHLTLCKAIMSEGYRPAAVSVADIEPGQALVAASVWQRPLVQEADKEKLAKRQAAAAVALLRMGQAERVWPLLKHSPDPRLRSYIINWLSPLGADPHIIMKRLDEETEVSTRRALVLSLGEFRMEGLSRDERDAFLPKLLGWYRDENDPGLHAAVEWLLRQWGLESRLEEIDRSRRMDKSRLARIQEQLANPARKAKPRWYENGQGQTMAVLPGPVEFLMGSPPTEAGRNPNEQWHRRRIGRSFAIAAKPVTVKEFRRFLRANADVGKEFEDRQVLAYLRKYSPEENCPIVVVNWYMAAAYCNWLSQEEGLPRTEWCYEPNQDRKYADGMKMAPGYLGRTGYRLPTEAEWEYACRAGATTARYYGQSEELLPKYAWYEKNGRERSWPVGGLKPNDFGLFDMQGNVCAWSQDVYRSYPQSQGDRAVEDNEDNTIVSDKNSRVWRGSSFNILVSYVRSADRDIDGPANRTNSVGFRPARTLAK